ncbi:MAG: toprim domain-containing protein, partial [Coprobacillus sp.]|nr:toprim domain-containing protein [Coprobacillus sp.]
YQSSRLDEYLYIVEGFMDVIALEKIGVKSAVALMGTALTKEHIALLRQLKVELRICLDGDSAGLDAALKMSHLLSQSNLPHRIVNRDGDNRDLDEIYSEDGESGLRGCITRLENSFDFELTYYASTNKLKTNEEKSKFINDLLPGLDSVSDNLSRNDYVNKIAAITGFSTKVIFEALDKYHNTPKNRAGMSKEMASFIYSDKDIRRLYLMEKEYTYHMLHSKEAVDYYNKNEMHLYNEVYREVADYLVDYAASHDEIDYNDILNSIYMSSSLTEAEKEKLHNEIEEIYYEKGYTNECTPALIKSLATNIASQMNIIHRADILRSSITGKDSKEKARIYMDHQRDRHIDKK